MLDKAMDLDKEALLSPVVHLKYDASTLALDLSEQLSEKIDRSRPEIKTALSHALKKDKEFRSEMISKGKEIMTDHDPEKPLVVVTGRPYNLYDERLNLRLGNSLSKIGVTALPMDFVDVSDIDLSDFPSMYWGLGASILRTAKLISSRSNYFGLHLTNFSCGADSFLEHFYKHLMGEKPYLILELDEHSAVAGVMTRLEAYRNVIENSLHKINKGLYRELKVSN
jgi:predicted nucleotide-binding protein (sugar kinase/HSP70/actin superfamily)